MFAVSIYCFAVASLRAAVDLYLEGHLEPMATMAGHLDPMATKAVHLDLMATMEGHLDPMAIMAGHLDLPRPFDRHFGDDSVVFLDVWITSLVIIVCFSWLCG